MQVNISYFAMLREAAGQSTETVLLDQPVSVKDLYLRLASKHGIDLSPEILRFAINDQFVTSSRMVQSDDHIVIIPPVSGG